MTSGIGVTDEFDRKQIYRKRSMPRRMRRRYKRFHRKVQGTILKTLGTTSVVRNNSVNINGNPTEANQRDQSYAILSLYGQRCADVNNPWFNDIYSIIASDLDNDHPTSKFLFSSGVLDITCQNNSQANPTTGYIPHLEVDVYEMSAGDQTAYGNTPQAALSEAEAITESITGAPADSLTLSKRGTTPWDFPQWITDLKLKIWKKTKFILGPNQTFTYQTRDPKFHVFDAADVRDNTHPSTWNKPRVTKLYLILAKTTPGFSAYEVEPGDFPWQLSIGLTRKYMYKINKDNTDRDAYL